MPAVHFSSIGENGFYGKSLSGSATYTQPYLKFSKGKGFEAGVGFKASGNVVEAGYNNGGINGSVKMMGAESDIHARASWNSKEKGISVGVGGSAYLTKYEANATFKVGTVTIKVGGDASLGSIGGKAQLVAGHNEKGWGGGIKLGASLGVGAGFSIDLRF